MTDDTTPPSLVSKTTPYATVKFNDANGTLQLPANFRFEGAQEIFVWRDSHSKALTLSLEPPSMSIQELFETAGVDNDCILPDFKKYMEEKYQPKVTKATKRMKRTA